MSSRKSLTDLITGEYGTVLSFEGGRAVSNRLTSLGFTPGVEINVVQNYGRGPIIVTVRGGRVALGRGEARKIIVQGSH